MGFLIWWKITATSVLPTICTLMCLLPLFFVGLGTSSACTLYLIFPQSIDNIALLQSTDIIHATKTHWTLMKWLETRLLAPWSAFYFHILLTSASRLIIVPGVAFETYLHFCYKQQKTVGVHLVWHPSTICYFVYSFIFPRMQWLSG